MAINNLAKSLSLISELSQNLQLRLGAATLRFRNLKMLTEQSLLSRNLLRLLPVNRTLRSDVKVSKLSSQTVSAVLKAFIAQCVFKSSKKLRLSLASPFLAS
jgi:hypothetical protein